jgi:hypothetical protein
MIKEDTLLEQILKYEYEKEKKMNFFEEDLKKLADNRIITIKDWRSLTENHKKIFPVGLTILFDQKMKNINILYYLKKIKTVKKKIKDSEGFIFEYKERKTSEEILISKICTNFLSYIKKRDLHQKWSIITIIGGSGIGKHLIYNNRKIKIFI